MSALWPKIVTSDHAFYSGHCSYLVVPAPDGEIGIMLHHEAMILAIQEGNFRFRVLEETKQYQAIVGRGTLQVTNNRVTMTVDIAERPEDIDKVRIGEVSGRIQGQLYQKQSLREFKMSQASMTRALTRLKEGRPRELK